MLPILRTSLAVASIALPLSAQTSGPRRWTPAAISTAEYEASATFTPDGREMYFLRADRNFANYRLLVSRCVDGQWSAPVPPSFAAPAPIDDADPFVTPDGRRLYFVSARNTHAQTGNENLDIFYVERQADGSWGAPQRLPEPVNSPASELLPRVDGSGRLYFGSSRPGGFGASDIYTARQAADGSWTVENLGSPVSTPANEYEADISLDGETLVVVADRGDRSHLYVFQKEGTIWIERNRVPADPHVFQVGPRLSPRADRLLFAQASGELSGELFLLDLGNEVDRAWPPACSPALPPSIALPAELDRVLRDYETAWAAKDPAGLARLFAEDGFVLPNSGVPVRGRAAIEKYYTGHGGPLALRAFASAAEGSVGYILGGYAGKAGEPDDGKFTLTLRKDPAGRWWIVSDMDNSNRRRE